MAVALMFVPRSPNPAAGPAAAALTRPRPRAASSPAPTEGCAETRARLRAARSPSLFSQRSMPPLPLRPPAHGLLRGWKMDYSDRPGLLRRRAVPRTGKRSVPLGLLALLRDTRDGTGFPVLLCLSVTCPEKTLLPFSTAITIFTAAIAVVVIAVAIIGAVIIMRWWLRARRRRGRLSRQTRRGP